jgi:hypothetical protein
MLSGRRAASPADRWRAAQGPPLAHSDVHDAKALIAANLRRIVWGSDWPHPDSSKVAGRAATDVAPLQPIDDGAPVESARDVGAERRSAQDDSRRQPRETLWLLKL